MLHPPVGGEGIEEFPKEVGVRVGEEGLAKAEGSVACSAEEGVLEGGEAVEGDGGLLDAGGGRGEGGFDVVFVVFEFFLDDVLGADFDDGMGVGAAVEADGNGEEGACAGVAGEEFAFDDETVVARKEGLQEGDLLRSEDKPRGRFDDGWVCEGLCNLWLGNA